MTRNDFGEEFKRVKTEIILDEKWNILVFFKKVGWGNWQFFARESHKITGNNEQTKKKVLASQTVQSELLVTGTFLCIDFGF